MAFELSPGVEIQERDLTLIIPAVATTAGGFAGAFTWGPANERILISSESDLRSLFGNPGDDDAYGASSATGINSPAVDFFTAAEFLGYGNNLQVVRALGDGAVNANAAGSTSGVQIINEDDYEDTTLTTTHGNFVAKYPGDLGNSLMVSMCDGFGGLTSGTRVYRFIGTTSAVGAFADIPAVDPSTALSGASVGLSSQQNSVTESNTTFKLLSKAQYSDSNFEFYIQGTGTSFDTALDGLATSGNMYVHFSSTAVFQISQDADSVFEVYESASGDLDEGTSFNIWKYRNEFEENPSTSGFVSDLNGLNDEMHIVVIDQDGVWTGTPGTVLERFPYVSKASGAKKSDGTSNYWVDVLRENSQYIWAGDTTVSSDLGSVEFSVSGANQTFGKVGVRDFVLSGGDLGAMPTASQIVNAYNTYFADPETVDIQLLIGNGAATETNAKTIADALITIADARKDCVAFLSPSLNDVSGSTPMVDVIEFRNRLTSTSYAVITNNWKQRIDTYNDKFRWIPLSGDIAGLCVRTDRLAEPWFSPAGYNRGQIRNVAKLAWQAEKAERDRLYARGINPVVTFPSEGTILYGDKTMLSRPSAFDRINVRRLFITLEKAIATASKYLLFELNDEVTRLTFRNAVEPFLQDVEARRGITDFRVIADTTNNTANVIDSNQFVADIYIKPARSINFINLNFIATPSGLTFDEVIG